MGIATMKARIKRFEEYLEYNDYYGRFFISDGFTQNHFKYYEIEAIIDVVPITINEKKYYQQELKDAKGCLIETCILRWLPEWLEIINE